jgi:orotidine-5'-phosphate decarboxylase
MDRVQASREIALILALDLGPHAMALRILRATRETFADRYADAIAHEVHQEFGVDVGLEKTIAASREGVAEQITKEEGQIRSRAAASYGAFRARARRARRSGTR